MTGRSLKTLYVSFSDINANKRRFEKSAAFVARDAHMKAPHGKRAALSCPHAIYEESRNDDRHTPLSSMGGSH
jgi:hypothetical protein